MAIDFVCLFCGTKYRVPDTSAGRRARCKSCQRSMTVPGDVPVAKSGGAELAELIPESALGEALDVPAANGGAAAATAGASALRAKATIWLQRLDRVRPRSAPVWVGAFILTALVVGLLSDYVALADFFVLGSAGLLTILIALGWGLLVGVSHGSGKLMALFAAVPTSVIVWLVLRFIVAAARTRAEIYVPTAEVLYHFALGLSIAFTVLSFVVGLVTNPKAFKRPALLALAGGAVVGTCWMPMLYRAWSGLSSSPSRATPSGGPTWQPPKVPGPPLRPPFGAGPSRPVAPRNPPVDGSSRTSTPRVAETPATAPAASDGRAVEQVEVKWGATWYAARVIRRTNGWTWVEYTSDQSREWVEPWRLRRPGSTSDTTASAQPNATWGKSDAAAPADPPRPSPRAH